MQYIMSFTTQDACLLIESVLRKKNVNTASGVSFDEYKKQFNVSLDLSLKQITKTGGENGKE